MALESSTPAIEHVPVALPDSQSPGTKVPEVNVLTSTPETNVPEVTAEPTPAAALAPGIAPAPPRYRLRFRKAGDLRLVSHHDLMHVFERLFRRADVPILYSRGFNPHPKLSFAQSLALGIVGENEVMEIDLQTPMAPEELKDRLNRFLPQGIEIRSAKATPPRASAQVRRAFFRLVTPKAFDIESAVCPTTGLPVRQAISQFLASESYVIVRERPHQRKLDIRPYVQEVKIVDGYLELALWVTPHGSARPEEIVNAVGLSSVFDDGAYLVRSDLELYDEAPDSSPPMIATMLHPKKDEPAGSTQASKPERAVAPQPTSLMSNPLSFDT